MVDVPPTRTMPKWESDLREGIKQGILEVRSDLSKYITANAGEAETRMLVMRLLTALGFRPFDEISQEYMIRGQYADFALKIGDSVVALVEVKAVGRRLRESHLTQVQTYALNLGAEWALLTNGQLWQAYHITAARPVSVDLFLAVDLLDSQVSPEEMVNALFPVSKEAFVRGIVARAWLESAATSPTALAAAILSPPVLSQISKEIRRRSGRRFETADLANWIRVKALRTEALP
jgi:predicted type IV restriction endonuclease